MFSNLGESVFDDYWMNYGKIIIPDAKTGKNKSIKNLKEFIQYKPVRVMFYYPNRAQAITIQKTLQTLCKGVDAAWNFIEHYTGINLKKILFRIAEEKTRAAK